MKILVNEMPKKKEECLYHRKFLDKEPKIKGGWCSLNSKACSFKNGESIFGGECRCLNAE